MKIFIQSLSVISPQRTFDREHGFMNEVVSYDTNRLRCIEPDYAKLIDPKMIRRMSRVIKMGVAAGLSSLREAGIDQPDAIITATAYGCLEDTGIFLRTMVEQEGEPLAPTAFVHSTHNTIGAQIALLLKCHHYNNTFVSGGSSFESALLDASLLLAEKEAEQVLVGGIDEMTDDSYTILNRLGVYRGGNISPVDITTTTSKGTIAGEGAAFFVLGATTSGKDLAVIDAMHTFYKPSDDNAIEQQVRDFLAAQSIDVSAIDCLVTGKNGDTENDAVYDSLVKNVFSETIVTGYKHLCGEYPTSIGFALALAAMMISNDKTPDGISPINTEIKKILVYNHYKNKHHSLILLSRTQ